MIEKNNAQIEAEASVSAAPRLWLSVEEVAPLLGDKPDAIYRDIREGQFPFEFKKRGRRIEISARSIGLLPPFDQQPEPQSAGAAAQK